MKRIYPENIAISIFNYDQLEILENYLMEINQYLLENKILIFNVDFFKIKIDGSLKKTFFFKT